MIGSPATSRSNARLREELFTAMPSPAAQVSQPSKVEVNPDKDLPFRPPHHSPDILQRLYVAARQLTPFAAILSAWVNAQRHGNLFEKLVVTRVPLADIFVLFVLMVVWNGLFRSRSTEGRDTPRARFIIAQLASLSASIMACSLVLWCANRSLQSIAPAFTSPYAFAERSTFIGAACIFATAIAYSIAYRTSAPQLYVILGTRRKAISAYKNLRNQGRSRGIVMGFVDPDHSHAKYLPGDYLGGLDRLENIL